MQLSSSLLPFDLPAANAVAGTPGALGSSPAEATADFGAFLSAESASPTSTLRKPEIPGAPFPSLAVQTTLAEPSTKDLSDNAAEEGSDDESEPAPVLFADSVLPPAPPASDATPRVPQAAVGEELPADPSSTETLTEENLTDSAAATTDATDVIRRSRSADEGVAPNPERSRLTRHDGNANGPNATSSLESAAAPSAAFHAPAPETTDAADLAPENRQPAANVNVTKPQAQTSQDKGDVSSSVTRAATIQADPSTQASVQSVSLESRAGVPMQIRSARSGADPVSIETPSLQPQPTVTNSAAATPTRIEPRLAASPDQAAFARSVSEAKSRSLAAVASPATDSDARIENLETSTATQAPVAMGASPRDRRATPAENFAVSSPRTAHSPLAVYKPAEKPSQLTENAKVEDGASGVGTNAAKPESLMPSAASHLSPAPHALERLSQAVAPLTFESDPSEGTPEPVEIAQAARRAVNAAVAVTEQFAADRKPSVTLKFSVSGVDLGVRVELRGENVHTTFRTDSPELRAALAQEWHQVAAAQPGDRASRLADPVFTSNSTPSTTSANSNGSAQSDLGAGDQRGSQQRQEHAAANEWARFRALARPTDSISAATTTPALASRSTAPVSPGRLRTFA